MTEKRSRWDNFLFRANTRRWARIARNASNMPSQQLATYRGRAEQLKPHIDTVLYAADERFSLPLIGSNAILAPDGTDWKWRPQIWKGTLPQKGIASAENQTKLGDEATLFHDCAFSEVTLRQVRNKGSQDLAPYGMRMDVFAFDGSFLSIAIDLPLEVTHGLLRKHLVGLETHVQSEKPLEIFARLNVRHGPNTEQLVRELSIQDQRQVVEFDLAYTDLNEKRVERLWLDLIFERPELNQVLIRDLSFFRRPRAEL